MIATRTSRLHSALPWAFALLMGTILCPFPAGAAQQDDSLPTPPGELTLGWAVDAALIHYPAVAVAQQGLEGARAGQGSANAAWWPRLTVGGTISRFQFPMLVRPLHELDANKIRFDNEPIQGSVFMDWLVFDGGERRARIRQAEAATDGADAGLATTRMGVIEATVQAFLQVRTLREIRDAQGAQVEALEAEHTRASLLLDVGRAPRVEVLRAGASAQQAEADLASVSAMLRAAEDHLGRLVNLDGAVIRERPLAPPRSAGADLEAVAVSSEPVPADSLHPVLRESWSRVLQANAIRSEAKATWIPDLGLSAGARQYGATSGDFANEWQIGLALSYPLFTGFRRSSEIEAAGARLGMAREQHRQARLDVAQAMDEADAALLEADARVAALEEAVEQFDEVARIEALALEAGAGVQRDFLDARAALFQSQAALADARNGRLMAWTRRAAAQGVLDRTWIRDNLETQP